MSPIEVKWKKFKSLTKCWILVGWDRLMGGKRHKAKVRIKIEWVECRDAWDLLEKERIDEFIKINGQNSLNESQRCKALEECTLRYLEKKIAKAIELREISLREVPSVAWPPHFDELRADLVQLADRTLASIPIALRQKALQYPSGSIQSDASEPDHFLVSNFRSIVDQRIDLIRSKAELPDYGKSSEAWRIAKFQNSTTMRAALLGLVGAIGIAWWQNSESRSQSGKSSHPQPELRQDAKIQSSPNATVIQSRRDTIVSNPPPKVEVKPEPTFKSKPTSQATTPKSNVVQTMVNSPGGIQALGNVTVQTTKRLIERLEFRIDLEFQAPPNSLGPKINYIGSEFYIIISSVSNDFYRFTSSTKFVEEQTGPMSRRFRFHFTPEDAALVQGQEIAKLLSINSLSAHFGEVFKQIKQGPFTGQAKFTLAVFINGIFVGTYQLFMDASHLSSGEPVFWGVYPQFQKFVARYYELTQ